MKRLVPLATAAALLVALGACTATPVPSTRFLGTPMFVFTKLDTERLMGKWYEVASLPLNWTTPCPGTTVQYTKRTDGMIGITRTCREGGSEGPVLTTTGVASLAVPGVLNVQMDGVPLTSPYTVLYVSRDYRLMVLGVMSRASGWVMSRDRKITPEQWDTVNAVLERNNYDIAALQRTPQR